MTLSVTGEWKLFWRCEYVLGGEASIFIGKGEREGEREGGDVNRKIEI